MNNQQVTKILNFLRINYDFHSPYTYIIDGNFLKLLMQKQIDFEHRLKSIISGKHQLKTTNCIISELEMLGNDFRLIYQKSKQLKPLNCSHTFQSVDRCILDHCSGSLQNLIVCSQDKMLRRRLRHKKVGLIYFGPDQRITMEDIERKQFDSIKNEQKNKLLPSTSERLAIQQFKQEEKVKEKIKKKKQQYKMASQKGIELKYLKKKILKGPNPLSVQKKKQQFSKQSKNNQIAPKKKRIRKRKNKSNGGQSQQ